jgi:hypothetical protein
MSGLIEVSLENGEDRVVVLDADPVDVVSRCPFQSVNERRIEAIVGSHTSPT